ncbi:PHP domain-containing protein [Arsenicicoccus sp. oral taxon 190]|uniref:PHP domain-containing protein n=1 Tax=Arsenicicoccus sp. oral taxon 190 TaxID=1658671 RepID=UPI00067A2875|nr:PHP domain-containing protein [Arsenicicoccus sp. oral taxon 190]AKT51386.1 metal-dependent phosphoesterase [Arsenicicoccus sp. oral taxon 190]
MRIDLHTHSVASDGTQAPADVLRAARAAGLQVVALTDHDTTSGWQDAAEVVPETGVALVRGMELSCSHRGISIHLLSYLHDPEHPGLVAEIERARESRATRARRIVERLQERFPELTYDEVLAQAGDGATIGRPHIADALVALGACRDRGEVFRDYLYDASPYYVPHYAPDPVAAVRLVRAAGGVPVMAHPFAAARGRVVDDAVIEEMAQAGLAGLEVDHRDHDERQRAHAAALARGLRLAQTGSSDYHGDGKLNRLGERTTSPDVLARIEDEASGVPVLRP